MWASHLYCALQRWAVRWSFGWAVRRVRWQWRLPFVPHRRPTWQPLCYPASWHAEQNHPYSGWWQYHCSPAGNRPVRIHRVRSLFAPICPALLLWRRYKHWVKGREGEKGAWRQKSWIINIVFHTSCKITASLICSTLPSFIFFLYFLLSS